MKSRKMVESDLYIEYGIILLVLIAAITFPNLLSVTSGLFTNPAILSSSFPENSTVLYESFDSITSINMNKWSYSGIELKESIISGNAVNIDDNDKLYIANETFEKLIFRGQDYQGATVSFWVKPEWEPGTKGKNALFEILDGTSQELGFRAYIDTKKMKIYIKGKGIKHPNSYNRKYYKKSVKKIVDIKEWKANEWHKITLITGYSEYWKYAPLSLYIDGRQVDISTMGNPEYPMALAFDRPFKKFYLGSSTNPKIHSFNGLVDELYIYNYAKEPKKIILPKFQGIIGKISLSTMKDVYVVNETVLLTDPPEKITIPEPATEYIAESEIKSGVSSGKAMAFNYSQLPEIRRKRLENIADMRQSIGYIIQLKDEPLVEKKQMLQEDIEDYKEIVNKVQREYDSLSPWVLDIYGLLKKYDVAKTLKDAKKDLNEARISLSMNLMKHKAEINNKQLEIESILKKTASNKYSISFNGMVMNLTDKEVEQLKKDPDVINIVPDTPLQLLLNESADAINADDVWRSGITGKGVKIAVIDTGIDYTHTAFGSCTSPESFGKPGCKIVDGYDFGDNDNDPMDIIGHGTHVAATAAGKEDYNDNNVRDNDELWGVAPDAGIYAYKVADSRGFIYTSMMVAAVERALDPNGDGDTSDKADIIQMSLGVNFYESGAENYPGGIALENAISEGIVAVVSAGNSGPRGNPNCITLDPTGEFFSICNPAAFPDVIAVGATCKPGHAAYYVDDDGNITGLVCNDENPVAAFSSRGPVIFNGEFLDKPDIAAPGVFILAAWPSSNRDHAYLHGTSMASPHVSGVVALMKQAHPEWGVDDIRNALYYGAVDFGLPSYIQGSGMVDADNSVTYGPSISLDMKVPSFVNDKATILGTASGSGFIDYKLEYGDGEKPSSWTVIKSSSTKVEDGLLGMWNTSAIKDGIYTIRLGVRDSRKTLYRSILITVDHELKEGWPKQYTTYEINEKNSTSGADVEGNFIAEDIDGDGENEIIFQSTLVFSDFEIWKTAPKNDPDCKGIISPVPYIAKVTVIDSQGNVKHGWPQYADHPKWQWSPEPDGVCFDWIIEPSFADQMSVGDIDGDGEKEIILATDWFGFGKMYAWNPDGSRVSGWPKEIEETNTADIYRFPVAVEDIDNNGKDEVLFSSHFMDGDASNIDRAEPHKNNKCLRLYEKGKYPTKCILGEPSLDIFTFKKTQSIDISKGIKYAEPPIYTFGPAVADLDGDGKKEILLYSRMSYDSSGEGGPYLHDEKVHVYDSKKKKDIKPWPKEEVSRVNPIAVDLDRDGKMEVVYADESENIIYAYYYDGNTFPGFPVDIGIYYENHTSESWFSDIAVGDMDDDGLPEIAMLFTMYIFKIEGNTHTVIRTEVGLAIIDSYGNLKKHIIREYDGWYPGGYEYSGSPVMGDIDGDNEQEVIWIDLSGRYPSTGNLYALNYDLTDVSGFGFPRKMLFVMPYLNPTLADIDNNGKLDMLLGADGWVYAWEFDGSKTDWPRRFGNFKGTSAYRSQKAKSQVLNSGDFDIEGYLKLAVQKKISKKQWGDVAVIYQDSSPRIFSPKSVTGIDKIWENAGGYTPTEPGEYRVYGALVDSSGKVIKAITLLETDYGFTVV